MKPWEEIAETLSGEIKRELAEAYFNEKVALERTWEDFKKDFKLLSKKEEAFLLNVCRIVTMLQEEPLIEEFEKITGLNLKTCYHPQILESPNIRKRLFAPLKGVPFGLTSKNRFVKLFLKIYENLVKSYQSYLNTLKDFEEEYQVLKEETEKFYRRYDLSSLFGFFESLEGEASSLTTPEDKDKIYQSLSEKLRLEIPAPPSQSFEVYGEPTPLGQIKSQLVKLAKKAFEGHQNLAREFLKLASQES